MFGCLSTFLLGKKAKKKSKGFLRAADCRKKRISIIDLRVEPIDLVNPSTMNEMKLHCSLVPKTSPFVDEKSSIINNVLSNGRLARDEPRADVDYEGGDEGNGMKSMNREYSDLDLQLKEKLASHGTSTDLGSHAFEKKEIHHEIGDKAMIVKGHVSDPEVELTPFFDSQVLKRTCSNIETKQIKRFIMSFKWSNSVGSSRNLPGNDGVEIIYCSPLSERTSYSADNVMLKRLSSSQVLPSRSRKIWWKLFRWSHSNFHKIRAFQKQVSVHSAPLQKNGYSSDTYELDKETKKTIESDKQWVEFSVGSSNMDRVNAWVSNLEDCPFAPVNIEGDYAIMENEQTTQITYRKHLEIRESYEKSCIQNRRRAAEYVAQADNIVQSFNSFSSVAHISGMGLKAIPSMSTFIFLRSVNLSSNGISHITSGSLPMSLHSLDLSRNNISAIEGLRDLEKLRLLNLSNNRITRIGHGLSSCTVIKELYLSGNKISTIEGLHRLLKLTVLDLSFNKIVTTKELGQLVANYNSLMALNLLGNPILANQGDDQLRKAVSSLLPQVTYLNKQLIKPRRMRKAVMESVAKAALGDAERRSKRRLARKLSLGLAVKSRACEDALMATSFKSVKLGKNRHSS